MKKILIATHGNLADGFKSSIHVLAGKPCDIQTINAYVDENCTDYSKQISDFIQSVESEDEAVIFTDLMGGSVNQKVCQLCMQTTKHIHIVTGVNLMCILGILLESRPLDEAVLQEIVESSVVSLVQLQIKNDEISSDDEQDFLS